MVWIAGIFGKKQTIQPVAIDDVNFKNEVLNAKIPVLLDIWSDGCAPCKQLEPVIFDLAKKYNGKIKVTELNPKRGPKTTGMLGVRGTPTVIYFVDGKEVERIVGFRSSLYHSELIEQELLDSVHANKTKTP
jgi:thioredoxin 1